MIRIAMLIISVLINVMVSGCAIFSESRYTFTNKTSPMNSADLVWGIYKFDDNITNVVDYAKAVYTKKFIDSNVGFLDNQIYIRAVPHFSQPESYAKYRYETYNLFVGFCGKIKGNTSAGETTSGQVTTRCLSQNGDFLFSITDPTYIERSSTGRIRYVQEMYIYLPTPFTIDELMKKESQTEKEKRNIIGVKARSGNNKLELEESRNMMTFFVTNNSKEAIRYEYKKIPTQFVDKFGRKFDYTYGHFDLRGGSDCIYANNELVIINPGGMCNIHFMNLNLGGLNIADLVGGSMSSIAGDYIFEPFSEYEKINGY